MSETPLEYPKKRTDAWARDPTGPFVALEKELYAKARARGVTVKAASADAGIAVETGTKYERNEIMRKRISELRQGAEDFVGVSKAHLIHKLMQNADEAREAGAFKASNEALLGVYKLISEDKGGDIGRNMPRALPHTVTPEELKARLEKTFKKKRAPALPLPVVDVPAEEDEAAE